MIEDRVALIAHYHEMRAALLAAVDALSEEQRTTTRVDGWTVAQHLSHLAAWDEIRAAEVERISAGFVSAWKMPSELDRQFNDLLDVLRRDLTYEQARWELLHSRSKLIAALTNADERAFDPALYGEAGLHSLHELEHAGWIERYRDA